MIAFLENCLNDENYFDKMNSSNVEKINNAVEILISNARIEETRKLQQAHFGPLIGRIRTLDGKAMADLLKNDQILFIDFLQLFVIFLFRKDIENENHSHDMIRDLLKEKCLEILKEIKE